MTTDVILATPIIPPAAGGASVYMSQVMNILKTSDEYNPICITEYREEDQYTQYNEVPVFHILGDKHEIRDPIDYVENELNLRPDILHVHPHTDGMDSIYRSLSIDECGFVYEVRSPEPRAEHYGYGHHKAYLTINKELDQLVPVFDQHVNSEAIFRSPVAVNVDHKSEPVSHDLAMVRCIFVGAIHEYKGPRLAIRAVDRIDNAELLIAGSGVGAIEDEIEEHCDRASDCYYMGSLDHSTVLAEIEKADILVAPFSIEGEPRVIYEALKLGTPVVATDAGNSEKMIRDKGIITERSPDAIEKGIRRMINRYALYTSRIDARPVEGHSAKQVREGIFKAYEYVLND
jgi:glycosyltransferase involved in cell wall biosynthesis